MARSYQRVPGYTDNGLHRRFAKRQANKRIRKAEDVPNGRAFRRYSETWDICDYRWLYFDSTMRIIERFKSWKGDDWYISWYRAIMKK